MGDALAVALAVAGLLRVDAGAVLVRGGEASRTRALRAIPATTTLTPTSFEMTLPVASNLGAVADLAGVAFAGGIAGQGAAIIGSIANNTAVVTWAAVDVTSQLWAYTFSYQVI